MELADQVGRRLRQKRLRARTVQLKVRLADFSLITRAQTLSESTDITQELWQAAVEMLRHRLPAGHLPVRLLGMGVTGLDGTGVKQRLLFDADVRSVNRGRLFARGLPVPRSLVENGAFMRTHQRVPDDDVSARNIASLIHDVAIRVEPAARFGVWPNGRPPSRACQQRAISGRPLRR